jgi:hypothetical protein
VIEDHDCNTLRFHLDPQGKPVELEPDMTVWIEDRYRRLLRRVARAASRPAVFADPQWLTAFNNT